MRLLVDTRWTGTHGIGRFAAEVIDRLSEYETLPPGPNTLSPLNPFWLNRIISRLRPDVYFSPGFNPPFRCPVPFIFTIHDLIHLDIPDESDVVKKLYYHSIVKPAMLRAFRVLTVSEFSRRRIVEWGKVPEEKVVVVWCGVSSDFSIKGVKQVFDKPYLLFLGNDKPHKNLRRLLAAYAQSGRSNDVYLVLCSVHARKITGWIEESGLQRKVWTTGPLSELELQSYYRGALALVYPTLYEGFGLPALEAMACGTPVLTAAVTSLPEVVGDAAYFIEPTDIDSIAEGIRCIIDDRSLREELRNRGLARTELFSWDKTVDIVLDVIKEAL